MAFDLKSYTAASTLPVKLLQDIETIRQVRSGFIPPVHVQLNPTNRCNLNCNFCSCSERDKHLELQYLRLLEGMEEFARLGCKSATITGGGEPLLYKDINSLIPMLNRGLKIKVGLVSNGTQFNKLEGHQDITWCRVSSSDDRQPNWQGISAAIASGNGIDWAFSHVLTREPNWPILETLVDFANHHEFTHVRLVGDILDAYNTAAVVVQAKEQLKAAGIDDRRVVYQPRAKYTQGRKRCLISLLKPVVGADGGIYPCCGVQYAQSRPGRDYVQSMKMGEIEDIDSIWKNQIPFDGSNCSRCYYDDYNRALELLMTPVTHAEFV